MRDTKLPMESPLVEPSCLESKLTQCDRMGQFEDAMAKMLVVVSIFAVGCQGLLGQFWSAFYSSLFL